MPVGDPPPMPQPTIGATGWECPKCGATYAPWVASCSECKPPANSLRQRIAEAQPPVVLPIPYVPPPVYPLFPAPQWPYGQGVWCSITPATSTFTVNVSGSISPDIVGEVRDMARRNGPWSLNQVREDLPGGRGDDDDGTAGVPARI